ncbi:ABC transporter ATP-binding protein [Thiospirochaeta perfilievii]|uniref:ABC transporter ATP-binding protein n=1 Tax=Thiospirochaeta perfilievii TaxID=252967 RepID=A0A5C1QHS8_9SPIO|nr:ABC-F family ATP-binding cassette domain-containing protein [Thiospirochaeta perfilievii]QEN05812.1 ABC transporter ATP-binding protein [Thiospirochaeta perfilievii]
MLKSVMNLISIDKLSLIESDKELINNVSFGVDSGDKLALVGVNGCGKSTLLRVLTGLKRDYTGNIAKNNDLKISYLRQKIVFNKNHTILEHILDSEGSIMECIKEYHNCLDSMSKGNDEEDRFATLSLKMEELDAWEIESKIKSILGELGIDNENLRMSELSGGMLKKTALAHALIQDYNLLLLDEPTNHLDIDTITWLQNYLVKSKKALILVTHDRYFLDNITNRIIEIDDKSIYSYNGNYSYYIQKKQERRESEEKSQNRLSNILRRETEWLARGPKARTSKDRGRINRAYDMMDQVKSLEVSSSDFSITDRRLGKKILELKNISKSFDNKKIIKPFFYTFKRGEKIGIVGDNGSGKSTFLNLLTQTLPTDSGTVDKGINTHIGYFDQMGRELPNDLTVMNFLKSIASVITLDDGRSLTPTQFLELFLFPKSLFHVLISEISGGEKKRLYLISILLTNPNFLILDEPTNDFDIQTLTLLEDFLTDYSGCLIIVSHDRYFLDKVVDFLFIFDGDGNIKGFSGNYSDYSEYKAEQKKEIKKNKNKGVKEINRQDKKGLTFKEQKEFDQLENQIEIIENKISDLESSFTKETNPDVISENSKIYSNLKKELTDKYTRWEELGEKV